jgi:hypothetical protein
LNKEAVIKLINIPHLLGRYLGIDILKPIHTKWILYCWNNKESVSLQGHRYSYKTTAIIIVGTIRWLLLHPNSRIAIIRKTFTHAADILESIKKYMQLKKTKLLFKIAHGEECVITKKPYGKIDFNFKKTITPELSVTAHGLDAGLVGKHYDKIIMDDIITLKDRTSKAEREKTKIMIQEITTNILDPNQPYCAIGTPWHKDDGWSLLPGATKYTVYDTDLMTDEEIEKKKKQITSDLFSINYLLKHTSSKDKLFDNPNYIKHWNWKIPEVFAHIDTAFSGTHYCAMTILIKRNAEFIVVGKVYSGHIEDWINDIVKYYNKYKVKKMWIENNADKGATERTLKKRGLNVYGYMEKMNKSNKIDSILYKHFQNIYFVDSDTDLEYMQQIVDYISGEESDDAPDSLASLLNLEFESTDRNTKSLWEW